jgi:hypothetical protein
MTFARLRSWAASTAAPLVLAGLTLLAPARSQAGLLGGLTGALTPPAPEIVVNLLPGTSSAPLLSAAKSLGWSVAWRYKPASLFRLRPDGLLSASVSTVLQTLALVPGVAAIEQNLLFTIDGPVDGKQSQGAMFSDDFTMASMRSQPAMTTIEAVPVESATIAVVAVVDGGFDLAHEALPAGSLALCYDAFTGDSNPTDRGNGADGDGDGRVDGGVGHGTAVAALALAVAPSARISAIRALDDEGNGSTATLAAAIDWASSHGAQVINISAGSSQRSLVLEYFLAAARGRGVVVVAAAGNGSGGPVCYPASSSYAVAIAGVASDGTADPTSSRGSAVAASAPSVDIVAPQPRTTNGYGLWQGTSFSAAFFSGAVAQLLIGLPGTNPMGDTEALLESLTPFSPEITSAYGSSLGDGILDVARAMGR